MYKFRILEVALFAILVVGAESKCKKNPKDCQTESEHCFVNKTILLDLKNLLGQKEEKQFDCVEEKFAISIDIFLHLPICIRLLVLKDDKDCNGINFKKVELLSCGKIIYVEIEKSKACLLKGAVTIILEVGKIDASKNDAEKTLLASILHTVLGGTCDTSCYKTDCSNKGSNQKSLIGGLL